MDIKLSKKIGFCFGVKRAVKIAEDTLNGKNSHKVYSLGPIIHNPQVVGRLSQKGLVIARNLSEAKKGTLIIRSHGMLPSLIKQARKRLKLIDTTCPFVKRAQKLASTLREEGYQVIIVGDKNHPEVKTLVECSGRGAVVMENKKQAKSKKISSQKVAVVAQTTQSVDNFNEIVNELLKKGIYELRIFDTICDDAARRQAEAEVLAKRVDGMVIVGGRMSANTRRLAEICRKNTSVCHVETDNDLNPKWLKDKRRIGLASGASTPNWIITDVVKKIKRR